MNNKTCRLTGILVVAALAIAMFNWGMHTAINRPAGHDLLQMASAVPTSSSVTLTSLKTRVAQDGTDSAPPTGGDSSDESDEPGAIFQDVYSLVKDKYVDAMPTDTQFAHAAAAAMLSSLQDPATRFLEPADMTELADETNGVYHGLGAVTAVRQISHPKQGIVPGYTELRLTIVAPLPGSPADKAGLLPNDVITAVNGRQIATLIDNTGQFDPALSHQDELKNLENDPVSYNKLVSVLEQETKTDLPMTQAQSLLTDGTQKSLTLTVMRPGLARPILISLDPDATTVVTPVSDRTMPGNIGYIQINQFTDTADTQFAAALASLNPSTLKGLVLDLRDCPGGLLSAGEAIAARLTTAPSMGILMTKGRQQTPIALTPAREVACPIVVLVNSGTANTAELLAATLQESGDTIIGSDTIGDAGDVRPVSLHDGSGFTMTVGELLTAQHQSFAGRGIKPNILVPDTPGTDLPLSRAQGLLSNRVARS